MSDAEEHTVASIRPSVGAMASQAQHSGVQVLDGVPLPRLLEAIGATDVTLVHLWNSPELHEVLECDLPPCRLLVWTHVAGHTPPQVLPPEIFARATETVATSELAADWVRIASPGAPVRVIPPVGGWDRVQGVSRSARAGFNLGYIGTVAFTRISPRFVTMSLAAGVDEARFIVCGDGSAAPILRKEAEERGVAERFDFRGQLRGIGAALADFDLFGYPLRSGTSGSSDLSVKEAMYAGVPPVVLKGTACDQLVEDGQTGIVARDEAAYSRTIERLHGDQDERERLANNARTHATEEWTPSRWVPAWKRCFDRVMEHHPQSGPVLAPPDPDLTEGAARFLRALDGRAPEFELSIHDSAAEASAAAERISECDPLLAYEDNGLFDHRRRYPADPVLALWTGLFLKGQGRPALAAGELARARRLGLDPTGVAAHASVRGAG